jgi:hypothetical protein
MFSAVPLTRTEKHSLNTLNIPNFRRPWPLGIVAFTVLISRRASRAISARRLALLIVFTSAKKRRPGGEKDFKLLGLRLIIQNACFVHYALNLVRSIVFLWDPHWISVAIAVTEQLLTLRGFRLMLVGGDQR